MPDGEIAPAPEQVPVRVMAATQLFVSPDHPLAERAKAQQAGLAAQQAGLAAQQAGGDVAGGGGDGDN